MSPRPDSRLDSLLDSRLAEAPVERERLRVAFRAEKTANPRPGTDCVLLWMQKAQRAEDNPALGLAIHLANRLGLPLVALFVLSEYPGAMEPHYRFMLEGLRSCAGELRDRGVLFAADKGPMAATVARWARRAAILVADEGKLDFERRWRDDLVSALEADRAPPSLVLVETESVVPPFAASDRLEWSAATLRRKISARLPFFLDAPAEERECRVAARASDFPSSFDLFAPATTALAAQTATTALAAPSASAAAPASGRLLPLQKTDFIPGRSAGMARFSEFLAEGGLERYGTERNDPCAAGQSGMSPYLHFGQVSPVALARAALARSESAAQTFIEQLVVRRELALNFVLFEPGYARYESAVPEWARRSLYAHRRERANRAYSFRELEEGLTDDPYWNAAQRELVLTGKMHNYLRMYWGKRILCWFADPTEAFGTALLLNDTYSLDGRDPNGFAGVAWCFGRHDRPWPEKPLFGSVRSMVPSGLKRKFDVERYAASIMDLYIKRTKETS